MEYIEYDFCNLTDREEDPFSSDYDFCNSTDSEQGPSTDSDSDSQGKLDLDVQDTIDEVQLQLCEQLCERGSIIRPTLALCAVENRNLRAYMVLEDVIKEHALSFLPAKSLLRFRTVCKKWDRWIGSPFLAHKQSNNFRNISGLICQSPGSDPSFISLDRRAYGIPSPSLFFLPEKVDIISSCNGLICCQGRFGDNVYYICNPASKKWRRLPKPKYYHGSEPAAVLAFEPSLVSFAANYELICPFLLADDFVAFEIYSSRTNTWRLLDSICWELDASAPKSGGFYMKGFVYWETLSGALLVFNLKNDSLGFLMLPPTSGPHGVLTEVHGQLCYILPKKDIGGMCTIEIYGDLNMSLQRTIHINLEIVGGMEISGEVQALPCINGDTLIFLIRDRVIAYHVRADAVEFLHRIWYGGARKYLPYVNSLVPVAPEGLLEEPKLWEGICSGRTASHALFLNQDMF